MDKENSVDHDKRQRKIDDENDHKKYRNGEQR